MPFKKSRRSRRLRNKPQEGKEQPFFSKAQDTGSIQPKEEGGFFQKKSDGIGIGQKGDKYEQEADAVADQVVDQSGDTPAIQQQKEGTIQKISLATPVEEEKLSTADQKNRRDQEIQEMPEAQQPVPEEEKEAQLMHDEEEQIQEMSGEGEEKEKEKEAQLMPEEEEEMPGGATNTVQTKAESGGGQKASNSVSNKILNRKGKGRTLPKQTQQELESSLGAQLDEVNIHTDKDANVMTKELHAQAFTHGKDIFFNTGKYNPDSANGKRLLVHELTHVLQQNKGEIKRKEKIGKKYTHPEGLESPYKVISGTFDGRHFSLFGDDELIAQTRATSGRPYTVDPKHAKLCGGSEKDSYMNNPLYVGISENGPIPEGTYNFRASQIAQFNFSERTRLLSDKYFEDPFGKTIHGGDWGAGRVGLAPAKIVDGPQGCGNTKKRSGFYLHGGIMAGSSGCIDVGNGGFRKILKKLEGYHDKVKIKVSYAHPAPKVGAWKRAVGRFNYLNVENPTLGKRLKAFFSSRN